jgi:predicted amidohydrolase YtcJ
LDAAGQGHPVIVYHRGGHIAFVNSLAFKAAGVNETTPDPDGGRFEHDSGHLTGRVADKAVQRFRQLIPSRPTPGEDCEAVKLIVKMMNAKGIFVQRMRELHVIPVPFSGYVYYHGEKMHFYGRERLQHMFAMRSFLDAGLRPTDSSDYTASPFDPMMWLQSQQTRTDKQGNQWGINQRITVEEAIRCGTINGAYASYEEDIKGSIAPGKLADLIVLGRDPVREPASSLASIPLERTMVGGKRLRILTTQSRRTPWIGVPSRND